MSAPNGERLVDHLVEDAVEDGVQSEIRQALPHPIDEFEAYENETRILRRRAIVWGALVILFVFGLVAMFTFQATLSDWSWCAAS